MALHLRNIGERVNSSRGRGVGALQRGTPTAAQVSIIYYLGIQVGVGWHLTFLPTMYYYQVYLSTLPSMK